MGALEIDKGQIKSIYAIAAKLGMVEQGGGHEDALHMLVQGLTGKESVKALTHAEAQAVLAELRRRSAGRAQAGKAAEKVRGAAGRAECGPAEKGLAPDVPA